MLGRGALLGYIPELMECQPRQWKIRCGEHFPLEKASEATTSLHDGKIRAAPLSLRTGEPDSPTDNKQGRRKTAVLDGYA